MAQVVQLARPAVGQEPADCVRAFVFMANLAAQEASGDPASSVSVERVLSRLQGSSESDSVMLALSGNAAVDAPLSSLGYPLIASTVPAGTLDDSPEIYGFVHLSLPLLEDREVIEYEIVLDVDFLPMPGAELSDEGRQIIGQLFDVVETLSSRLSRPVVQTVIMHPVDQRPGTGPMAELLEARGYVLGLTEVQSAIDLPELPPARLPDGFRAEAITDYAVPDYLIDDVVELLTIASLDIPHGSLTSERAQWSPQRLTDARARLLDRGGQHLMVVAVDGSGRACALSEFMRHAGATPEVIEQGVTIVLPEYRRRGLGRGVKHWGLSAVRSDWPEARKVYGSNALGNNAMLAINSELGMGVVSGSSAWEARLV